MSPPGPDTSARRPLPAYFHRMSAAAQRRYLASDAIDRYDFDPGDRARMFVARLMAELTAGGERAAPATARELAAELCIRAGAAPVSLEVRGVRPRNARGELHGIYYPAKPPRIVLWMRTAQRRDVVKPKTFVRTLLHEVGHHLDYAALHLGDSYHTAGFFKRESWLMRALTASTDPNGTLPF